MRNRLLGSLRLLALLAGVAVLVWLARPERRWLLIGLPLLAAGESIRWWAAGHLLKSKELVTSGPYAYTQNPLYLGRLFILLGLGVMCTLPWGLNWVVLGVGLAGFFGYYMPRKLRVEGARLEGKHGDRWQRYRHSVPVLFPALRRYPDAECRPWSWKRMVRNREYLMVIGLASIMILLWVWLPG
ncbi:MAG: methyltransferase [Acidobacteriota bacterium]